MDHLLAILNRPETASGVLAAVRLVGQRLPGIRASLLHPRPDMDPDFMPTEEVMSAGRHAGFEARRDAVAKELTRSVSGEGSGTLQQIRGRVREVVAREARQASLVIAGSAGHPWHGEAQDAIDAVLFDAAAPLLLMPPAFPASLGAHVTVAWERSQAADEAVQSALPLLLAADDVTLLVAQESHVSAGLPVGLIAAMERLGRRVTVRRFRLAGGDIGEVILAEAHVVGADLLVMGAFTHRRAFEALFGGATREIMTSASIPLLLHH